MLGGLIGAFVGEVGALIALLPVAVFLTPVQLVLRPFAAGAIAGLVTFWISERIVSDESRGRTPLILLVAVLAVALHDGAVFFVAYVMDLPLPWVVSGLSLVRWPFVGLVGLTAGVAALTLRGTSTREEPHGSARTES